MTIREQLEKQFHKGLDTIFLEIGRHRLSGLRTTSKIAIPPDIRKKIFSIAWNLPVSEERDCECKAVEKALREYIGCPKCNGTGKLPAKTVGDCIKESQSE